MSGKLKIIIFIVIVVGYIFIKIRDRTKAKRIQKSTATHMVLSELDIYLTKLLDGNMPYEFFGITSDGNDCIYFMNDKGKLNIDFEVLADQQKPFVSQLKAYAKKHNYTLVEVTYGNKPEYNERGEAPMYSLKLHADKETALQVGKEIMTTIFNRNDKTVFEIVP